MSKLLTDKVKKLPASELSDGRYDFLRLSEAEPDFGVPTANNGLVASLTDGSRLFLYPDSGLTLTGNNISVSVGTVEFDSNGMSYSTANNVEQVIRDLDSNLSSAVGGTLSTVSSDTTLSGDGTVGNQLSVVDYGHSHYANNITDFAESVDDRVGALIQGGSNVSVDYDDANNVLTLSVSGALTATSIDELEFLDFTPSDPGPSHSEGRVYYNSEYNALTVYNNISDVSLQVGLEEWVTVYNDTGNTIPNGTPVYATGAFGEYPTVAPADATTEAKARVIGIATHDIADSSSGVATTRGLISGIDTSTLTAGQGAHLAPNGTIQSTAPTYPYYPVDLGWCVVSDATNGYVYVTIEGHTFEQFRVTGNQHIDGNLQIDGDLVVTGTQSVVSQASLNIDDSFVYLNSGDTIGIDNTNFSGTGLNDAYFNNHYEGTTTKTFYVRIDGVGTGTGGVDTFEWSLDNFSTTEATGVDLADEVLLSDNICIHFNATTGHTSGDTWSGTAAPLNIDSGWFSNRNTGTSGVGYTHMGIFFDVSDNKFKVVDVYDPEPTGTIDTGDASFSLGTFVADTFEGDLSGNANTATSLATARTISLIGDASGSIGFDGSTNVNLSVNISSIDNAITTTGYSISGYGAVINSLGEWVGDPDTVRGYTGSQGPIGFTGSQGIIGYTGSQGAIGYTGSQGDQGIIGYTGSQGIQGVIGYTGSQGPIGYTGSKGEQGIQGFTGSQGIQGVIGFTGSQGPIGYTGSRGADGATGFTGSQGIQGEIGYTGSQGIQGIQGYTGSQGDQGVIGFTGSQGIQGFTGSQGVQGVIGYTGSQGDQGVQGIIGYTGSRGFTGSQGIQGVIGYTGSQGIQGEIGYTGSQGIQGIQGFTGSQGVIGYTGSQGIQGIQGFTGSRGTDGIIGVDGYTGSQGYTGSRGLEFNWTKETSNYTASDKDSIIADTSGGPWTLTLPASPNVGDVVSIVDGDSWQSNNLTVARNGSTIEGDANDVVLDIAQIRVDFVYDGTTWQLYTNVGKTGFTGSQGTIGYTGSRGSLGYTGSQGIQGAIGYTGSRGIQGVIGYTGSQGIQGAIGYTGSRGIQGVTGFTGSRGSLGYTGSKGADGNFGGATFDYTFDTNTVNSDPGVGKLKFNNANVSLASSMYIDDQDDNATDIQTFLRTIDDSTSALKGHFRVSNRLNADDFAIFTISSISESTGYFVVNCSYVSGSATSFSSAEDVIITFARTGDKGDTGPQGVTGFTGSRGSLGYTGSQGVAGPIAGTDGQLIYNNGGNAGGTSQITFNDASNSLEFNSTFALDGGSTTVLSTAQTAIASFSASSYAGGKFVIVAKDGNTRHIVELLITHDGTTAIATQYGDLYTNVSLATYGVDISGGNVRILATGVEQGIVYRVQQTLMLV